MRSTRTWVRNMKVAVLGAGLAVGGATAMAVTGAVQSRGEQQVTYVAHVAGHPVTPMWVTIENRTALRSNGHVQRIFPTRPGNGPREIAVTFDRNVTRCALQATPGSSNGVLNSGLTISATGALGVPQVPAAARPRTVLVSAFAQSGNTVEAGMHLLVVC